MLINVINDTHTSDVVAYNDKPNEWIKCGSEDSGQCIIHNSKMYNNDTNNNIRLILVKYGIYNDSTNGTNTIFVNQFYYRFVFVENTYDNNNNNNNDIIIPCNNDFFGDSINGARKNCYYFASDDAKTVDIYFANRVCCFFLCALRSECN